VAAESADGSDPVTHAVFYSSSPTMSKIKASTDFTHHLDTALCPAARIIHDRMSENAATFPAPPLSMAAL